MYVTKLLAIISCLWVGVQSTHLCVQIVQASDKLRILDNPRFEGGEETRDSWYRTINWKDDYHGSLKMKLKRTGNKLTPNGPIWSTLQDRTYDICNFREGGEPGSWAVLIREALGIPEGCPVLKGSKATNGAIFSAQPCKNMVIHAPNDELVGQNVLEILIVDDDNNKLVQGQLDVF